MNNFKLKIKQQIILLVCCFSLYSFSQPLTLSNQAEISVLTCGTGDEMYALFGHTALRVKDTQQKFRCGL